jgi:hypothetical protein
MKQKFTLLVLMMLTSAFVFGQSTVKKHSEKRYKKEHFDKNKAEKKTRTFDFKTKQKPVLKSANAEKQQLDYSIKMNWNSETSQWENGDKYEYTYDANNGKILLSQNTPTMLMETRLLILVAFGTAKQANGKILISQNTPTMLMETRLLILVVIGTTKQANGKILLSQNTPTMLMETRLLKFIVIGTAKQTNGKMVINMNIPTTYRTVLVI